MSTPDLSDTACRYLKAAAESRDSALTSFDAMGGLQVSANDVHLLEEHTPRADAQARAAIRELVSAGYIEDRAGSRELYFVTDAGFQFAEALTADDLISRSSKLATHRKAPGYCLAEGFSAFSSC